MGPHLVNFLLVFLFTLLFHHFAIEKLKATRFERLSVLINKKAFEAALLAAFAVIMVSLSSQALKYLAKPSLEVRTQRSYEEIRITVKKNNPFLGFWSGRIVYISIEYPVVGIVNEFKDFNTSVEAQAHAFVMGGTDTASKLNRFQLLITDMLPDFELTYGFDYKSPGGHFKIPHLWPGQNPPPPYGCPIEKPARG